MMECVLCVSVPASFTCPVRCRTFRDDDTKATASSSRVRTCAAAHTSQTPRTKHWCKVDAPARSGVTGHAKACILTRDTRRNRGAAQSHLRGLGFGLGSLHDVGHATTSGVAGRI